MDLVIAVVLVLLIGLLLYRLSAQRQGQLAKTKPRTGLDALDTVAAWPPQATRILTVAERKAYAALKSGLPECIVLAQVPLSRFMKVPTRNSYSEWLRRVGLMSVDLLVCDEHSQVIGVVDVRAGDGKENARARERHARMDRVLEAAGIPIHVWNESAIPSATAARNAILARVAQGVAAGPANAAATFNPVELGAMLDAEHHESHAHEPRDPPPSTWFDNLDSSAVPLNPGPRQSGTAAKSPADPHVTGFSVRR